MSDAIARMAFYLVSAPPWKPDRYGVQKEKTCSRCKKQKPMEKFGVGASLCKLCHVRLTQEWRGKRKRA